MLPPRLHSDPRASASPLFRGLLTSIIILACSAAPAHAATITVDSTVDAVDANPGDGLCATALGACTLRAAIQESNANTEDDAISIPAGTYLLTIAGTEEDAAATGDLDVSAMKSVGPGLTTTIAGAGTNATIIDADGLDRVLEVFTDQYHRVAIKSVTIRNGRGGIVTYGLGFAIEDSSIVDNTGVAIMALDPVGSVDVKGCTIARNGSGIISAGYGASIADSVVSENRGSGLTLHGSPNLHIQRTVVANNTASECAGINATYSDTTSSAYLTELIVTGNKATAGNGGGACFHGQGPFYIQDSTFAGNEASGDGGGIYVEPYGPIHLMTSTISGNKAGGSGGGVSGRLRLSFVTVADNVADADGDGSGDGGGIAFGGGENSPDRMERVIIADNVDGGGENDDCVASAVESQGYNLLGTASNGCAITFDPTDVIGGDPKLAPLATNGGTTPTRALLPGSAALDAAGVCTGLDQRGIGRPQGPACDIGAYERTPCGNGTVDPGEACDDGNVLDDDCCSATCTVDVDGSACEDGNACTTGAVCSGGSCAGGTPVVCAACESCAAGSGCVAAPRPSCHGPTTRLSGKLQLADQKTDKLAWTWAKGEATTLADFGDPVHGGGDYALCLYDESGPTAQVAFRATTRGGPCGKKPCWSTSGKNAFRYKDATRAPNGLEAALLKSGTDGKANILLTGKGTNLTLPDLPLRLPARMQLQAPNGQCWEARYFEVGTSKNDAKQFKGSAFQPTP